MTQKNEGYWFGERGMITKQATRREHAMTPIIVKSRVGSDGVLHLDLPVGPSHADKEVQVTVEPAPIETTSKSATITAAALLKSGLVGMWADRTDIGDSRDYARKLREQAQTRRRDA
jgi:hypothetical protein